MDTIVKLRQSARKANRDRRVKIEARIDQTLAEIVKGTGRGRPRVKDGVEIAVKALSRGQVRPGRPSRAQVLANLRTLGVEVDTNAPMRELEQTLRQARRARVESVLS